MANTASLKKEYAERIAPALMKQFNYSSSMQIPVLKKIVINQGLGMATADKKIIEVAVNEITAITGQKAVITKTTKNISQFKLRAGMNVGASVTLRRDRMYNFLYRLVNIVLPRVRDFRGVPTKSFDGAGNYTFGLTEQSVFTEIDMDKAKHTVGMNITIVTTAKTDDEARDLLALLGMPFAKN